MPRVESRDRHADGDLISISPTWYPMTGININNTLQFFGAISDDITTAIKTAPRQPKYYYHHRGLKMAK